MSTLVLLTTPGAQTWQVPAGVTSIFVECYGGGSGAWQAANGGAAASSGGGGGAYASQTLTVTALQTIYASVGANGTVGTPGTAGGDSWVNIVSNAAPTLTSQGALAKGAAAPTAATSGGVGGLSANCVGTVKNSGGTGGSAATARGGGGGGGCAGSRGVGGNGAGDTTLECGGGGGGANNGTAGNGSTGVSGAGGNGGPGPGGGGGVGGASSGAVGGNAIANSGGGGGGGGSSAGGVFAGGSGALDDSIYGAGNPGPGGGGGGGTGGTAGGSGGNGGTAGGYGGGGGGGGTGDSTAGTSRAGTQGFIAITYTLAASATSVPFTTPGAQTWQVPANVSSIIIEGIGGGAGGGGAAANGNYHGGTGGGGGAYAKTTISVTANQTIYLFVGDKGTGGATAAANGTDGSDTWANKAANSAPGVNTNGILAKAGVHGIGGAAGALSGGAGGDSASCIGEAVAVFSGGRGGNIATGLARTSGSGGGGSAGPIGIGKAGGNIATTAYGASGGGGSNGGISTAGGAPSSATGAAGGNGTSGSGAGGTNGGTGTLGGGGGGGQYTTVGGAGGPGGSDATLADATNGSGGGGGGGGTTSSATSNRVGGLGGTAGNYGGGGGGGGCGLGTGQFGAGGNGAPGVIVITYTEDVVPDQLDWIPQLPALQARARTLDTNFSSRLPLAPQEAPAQDITTGLLAWYKLNDGSGINAADSSGNSRTGTVTIGSGSWGAAPEGAAYNTGLLFNSSQVAAPSGVAINPYTQAFTISAFVYGTSFGSYPEVVGAQVSVYPIVFGQNVGAGGYAGINGYIATGCETQNTGTFSTDTWTHIAFTWTGSTAGNNLTVYKNGILQDTRSSSTNYNIIYDVFLIGSGTPGGCSDWNGFIQNVRFYNRALNADEVAYLATTDSNPESPPAAPSLNLGWWSEPSDLLHHPQFINSASAPGRLSPQQWATPDRTRETKSPDLLNHARHLDTNQSRLSPQQWATPDKAWWSQPPDLLDHAHHLDTNQAFDYAFDIWSRAPAVTPGVLWWSQPPDLLEHARHLDTNHGRLSPQQWATPSACWWSQPPDLLDHERHLDTNQGRLSPQQWATSGKTWWTQPPDLLKHASHLDTNQWTTPFARLNALAAPDETWWSQPPDLFRHPSRLDTNQPFDYAFDVWSRAPAITPSVLWWSQPPDLLHHPLTLWANEPYFSALQSFPGLTPGMLGWWSKPTELQTKARTLDTNFSSRLFAAFQEGPSADITTGLLAWYKLNDGSGADAVDSSGNNRTGAVTIGSGSWSAAPEGAAYNTGLLFNSSHVSVSSGVSYSLPGAHLTFSAFVYASSFGDYPLVIGTADTALVLLGQAIGSMYLLYPGINFYMDGSGCETHNPTSLFSLDTWTHITGVWDGSSISIYVNGSIVGSPIEASAGSFVAQNFLIGSGAPGGCSNWNGFIQNVRFYDRALSADDVSLLATTDSTPESPPAPNPTPSEFWWSQPPNLLRHPARIDTNQTFDYAFDIWSRPLAITPSVLWWSQPPNLLRHARHLDTNQLFFPKVIPPPSPFVGGFIEWGGTFLGWGSGVLLEWGEESFVGGPLEWESGVPLEWGDGVPLEWGEEVSESLGVWWWSQPPDLFRHAARIDTNQSTLPFAALRSSATSGDKWWSQPPDLLRRMPPLDTNQWKISHALNAFSAPQTQWWTQPPDLLRHPRHLDTNHLTMPFAALIPYATPSALWGTRIPDLLRHALHLDTNQLTLPFSSLNRFSPPSARWWSQPPDLLRHALHLDTNQGLDLWFAPLSVIGALTPSRLWWSQPPDLLWHARHLDTNQSRLVSQQWATPSIWRWSQPPDLLRHPRYLDTNQLTLPYPGHIFDTPRAIWWSQPPDLLRHPSHLDTNQLTMPFAALTSYSTPSILWSIRMPDLIRHPPHLDTNQITLPFAFLNLSATPSARWWSQPPDLLRHPRHLDTNQGLDLWIDPLSAIAALTPAPFWWSQPPDLLHRPPSLAAETPRQPTWFSWTASQLAHAWWTQPPDLLKHPRHLDTNQGADYAYGAPAITPMSYWWSQPPDLLRHPRHLDTNQPRNFAQQWATPSLARWWTQPIPVWPRIPNLLPIEPYIAPGWAFTGAGPFIAPHPLNRPVALTMPPWLQLLLQRILPPVYTPDIYWWTQPPDLFRHPPELWTWQNYIGKLVPFIFKESAFMLTRSALSSAASISRERLVAAILRDRNLVAANTIMQGTHKMSRAPDLCPPIIAGVEKEFVQFDFTAGLASGVTIDDIVAVNCYSLSGTDLTPSARILSVPEITNSPSSNKPEQAVVALFGNMVAGLYLVQAIVQTSDGQTLSVEARWPCVSATP